MAVNGGAANELTLTDRLLPLQHCRVIRLWQLRPCNSPALDEHLTHERLACLGRAADHRVVHRQRLTQFRDSKTRAAQNARRRRRERRGRRKTSRSAAGHLLGDQQVDFIPVILVIGQAFVSLRAGEAGKAVLRERVDRFPVLKETHHVMHPDSGSLDDGASAPHSGGLHNVTVGAAGGDHGPIIGMTLETRKR